MHALQEKKKKEPCRGMESEEECDGGGNLERVIPAGLSRICHLPWDLRNREQKAGQPPGDRVRQRE